MNAIYEGNYSWQDEAKATAVGRSFLRNTGLYVQKMCIFVMILGCSKVVVVVAFHKSFQVLIIWI